MVHSDNVVKFSASDWVEKIRPRLQEDNYEDNAGAIVGLSWGGPFEREVTALFASAEDATWFVLKYLGD